MLAISHYIETKLIEENSILFIDGNNLEVNFLIKEQIKRFAADNYKYTFLNELVENKLDYINYLNYYRPDLDEKAIYDFLDSSAGITQFGNALKNSLGLISYQVPILVKHLPKNQYLPKKIIPYNFIILTNLPTDEQIASFIATDKSHQEYIPPLNPDDLSFDMFYPDYDLEDADGVKINNAYQKLSDEIWNKIQHLKMDDAKLLLAQFLQKAIETNRETGKLIGVESDFESSPKLSRILITDTYRIFLPDYNNREIKMGNLPKALYFLFLKHPSGFYLKDLDDYKEELYHLYLKVTNFSDTHKLKNHIELLTNLADNSMYVNMARIKAAFVNAIDEKYALKYFPSGEKFQPKKITLPQSLIDLPPNF